MISSPIQVNVLRAGTLNTQNNSRNQTLIDEEFFLMGEEAESTNQRLGGSLPVPIVQAIADKNEVPDRYLRPDIDDEPIISDVDVELPIIDLARLLDP